MTSSDRYLSISRAPHLALVLGLCVAASAGGADDDLEIQTLPPEPEPIQEEIEPEVTIIQREDRSIEEYRVGGELRAVRVVPRKGKPYFLVDTDGDGLFDVRRYELGDDILVPGWVIHRW